MQPALQLREGFSSRPSICWSINQSGHRSPENPIDAEATHHGQEYVTYFSQRKWLLVIVMLLFFKKEKKTEALHLLHI